jgi:D-3-phosphoglycerate dehydrogenase
VAVHVGPEPVPGVAAAVTAGGGRLAPLDGAEAVVWLDGRPETLPALPRSVRWVQLPGAGLDRWWPRLEAEPDVRFTSATGVYARPVAEHALALLLAAVRRLGPAARATAWRREPTPMLEGSTVAVVGAGGIGSALVGLLAPHDVEVLAVTRSGRQVPGAACSLPADRLAEVWPAADHVVLAAPATVETSHMVGAAQLAAMRRHACLVNIARGALVDTGALVDALRAGTIAAAALDVVDPEPLPAGHPLWSEPRALVTPHVATPEAPSSPHFAMRVRENLARFLAGDPLLAEVDRARGY